MNFSYTKELETLILDTLLPAYEREQKRKGIKNPLCEINKDLLDQVKSKKKLAALLRPKEK